MTPAEEERRGVEAQHVMENKIYREAYAALEARYVDEMAQQDVDPKRAEFLRLLLVASRKHRKYLEQVMVSGTMAAMQVERKRTLAERMLHRY
jgi:hypothetical protein